MKSAPKRISAVERDLLKGLAELADDLKSGNELPDKYTCHRMVLDLEPANYRAADVKATRGLLNASQGLFAKFLGVSVKTVRAWEQGKAPSDMARRFMDEIRRDPRYWKQRLLDSAKVKRSP